VAEGARELVIQIDVPGVRREDVQLSMTGRMLDVRGTRTSPDLGAAAVRHSERPFGSFSRQLMLPPDAMTESVSAQIDCGVLTIRVARTQSSAETTRHVPLD
jgi:HSP20 family protein